MHSVFGLPLLVLQGTFISEGVAYDVDTVTNQCVMKHLVSYGQVGRWMEVVSNDNHPKNAIEL